MIIEGIINNNVISSRDDEGKEVVVMGRGIGFGKKKGDILSETDIDKIFTIEDEAELKKFKDLLVSIPLEYLQVSNEIISYAKEKLDTELHPNIYLTLTDHISFAIKRREENLIFQIPMENEIRRFFPLEYQIGKQSLKLISEMLGYELPPDEAAALAIHFVNAELNIKVRDTWIITKMMGDILSLISEQIEGLKEESVEKDSFTASLKLLSYRLVMAQPLKEKGDEKLYHFVKENYPDEWKITEKINEYVTTEYKRNFTEEEKLYFTIQIKRIKDLFE
nr:PRD domain-containing protein [uncultured Catonella sp.]